MPDPYCPPLPPPPPLFPPTIILSCTEPYRAPPPLPVRSTFCYSTTGKFFSKQELIDDKRRWETFERVENHNSIVREELANIVPATGIGQVERVWYQFKDNQERTEYKMGQFAHIAKLPSVTDFIQPYSNRTIPYTSSVLSSIASLPINTTTNCACERPVLGKTIPVDQRLSDIKALNLFVRVSTQTAKYPKSPYRFDSAEEYLLYKRYVSMNNVR
jgi:hypothetical protein